MSVTGLTIENEPIYAYIIPWNSLYLTPELERDFIKLDLGPALQKAGFGLNNFKVMIHDDQRPTVFEWAQVILGDKEAAKYVAGSSFHWYLNNNSNIVELDKAHKAFPNKFLLSTEACETWSNLTTLGRGPSLGNWAAFDKYAYDLITVNYCLLIISINVKVILTIGQLDSARLVEINSKENQSILKSFLTNLNLSTYLNFG